MVLKCPKEIKPHVEDIMNLCLEYICYDPNYNYDDDGDADAEDGDAMMDCDDDMDDESDDDYSDDDDMSWKVGAHRRESTLERGCSWSMLNPTRDLY